MFCAADSRGRTIDFILPVERGSEAAKRFVRKVLPARKKSNPRKNTAGKNAAYPKAVAQIKAPRPLGY